MTKEEKRLAARIARRKAKEAALASRIEAIRVEEHKAGFDKGARAGETSMRERVLEHAAIHYKNGQDIQAAAVRQVYRALGRQNEGSIIEGKRE